MFSIGYLTVVLYLASLSAFIYAAYYPRFFVGSSVIGALCFLTATAILGWMITKRKMTEFKH